jgi:hypothetical protein
MGLHLESTSGLGPRGPCWHLEQQNICDLDFIIELEFQFYRRYSFATGFLDCASEEMKLAELRVLDQFAQPRQIFPTFCAGWDYPACPSLSLP